MSLFWLAIHHLRFHTYITLALIGAVHIEFVVQDFLLQKNWAFCRSSGIKKILLGIRDQFRFNCDVKQLCSRSFKSGPMLLNVFFARENSSLVFADNRAEILPLLIRKTSLHLPIISIFFVQHIDVFNRSNVLDTVLGHPWNCQKLNLTIKIWYIGFVFSCYLPLFFFSQTLIIQQLVSNFVKITTLCYTILSLWKFCKIRKYSKYALNSPRDSSWPWHWLVSLSSSATTNGLIIPGQILILILIISVKQCPITVEYIEGGTLWLTISRHWISVMLLPTRIWRVHDRWGCLTRIRRFTSVDATWLK